MKDLVTFTTTSSPNSRRCHYHQSLRRPITRRMFVATTTLLMTTLLITWIDGTSGASSTIPRSTNRRVSYSDGDDDRDAPPPWNPSSQIDDDGFLTKDYYRISGDWELEADIGGKHGPKSRRFKTLEHIPVKIRQVPGDGNCLFHSISTCLNYQTNGTQLSMKTSKHMASLRQTSSCLRQKAVDCLEKHPKRLLFLQGNEYLRARDLVDAAASQYDLNGDRYCELMRKDSYWGGGPEIVALCNVLRRPIHVYELATAHQGNPTDSGSNGNDDSSLEDEEEDKDDSLSSKAHYYLKKNSNNNNKHHNTQPYFRLRRMACFGSPKFDRREPLHILSADSRFPDITPGKQLASGNHFLAMFPSCEKRPLRTQNAKSQRRRVMTRGGCNGGNNNNNDDDHHNHNDSSSTTRTVSGRLGQGKYFKGNRNKQTNHHKTMVGKSSSSVTSTKDGLGIWVFSFCWNQLSKIWHGMK
mmetsp:Transcript_24608/g.34729  ORF Transcript_24608/g.34729 Transcript_24608/m.34729 type:complete len:468 (-) Transcript_24608:86-1489(-)